MYVSCQKWLHVIKKVFTVSTLLHIRVYHSQVSVFSEYVSVNIRYTVAEKKKKKKIPTGTYQTDLLTCYRKTFNVFGRACLLNENTKERCFKSCTVMGWIGVFVIIRDDCWLLKPVRRTPVRRCGTHSSRSTLPFSHTHTVYPMTHLDAKQKLNLSQTSKYNFQIWKQVASEKQHFGQIQHL